MSIPAPHQKLYFDSLRLLLLTAKKTKKKKKKSFMFITVTVTGRLQVARPPSP